MTTKTVEHVIVFTGIQGNFLQFNLLQYVDGKLMEMVPKTLHLSDRLELKYQLDLIETPFSMVRCNFIQPLGEIRMTKLTVKDVTEYTAEEIQAMSLPDRIKLQDSLANNETKTLIIDAVVQRNVAIIEGFLTVYELELAGHDSQELYNFRKWLQSLLM